MVQSVGNSASKFGYKPTFTNTVVADKVVTRIGNTNTSIQQGDEVLTESIQTANILVTGNSTDPNQTDVYAYNGSERLYALGTQLQQNGALYRYCYVTSVAETANLGVSDTDRDYPTTVTGTDSAKSLVSGTITMLNNSGAAFVENDPRVIGSLLCMTSGSNWGLLFNLTGNTAAANGASITYTYTNNIQGTHSVQVGDSVTFASSKYVVKNAVNDATNVEQTPVGAYTAGAVPGAKYLWLQTKGIAVLKGDQTAITKGSEVAIGTSGVSAGRIDTRTTYDEQLIGRALQTTSGANEFLAVQLALEV